MQDILIIRDLETLRTIADSRRVDILRLLMQPMTASQVGQRLGETSNSIYYHINELEKKGLVALVETRLKGHLTEKYYQAVARSFTPSPTLFESNFEAVMQTGVELYLRLLDTAAEEMQRALAANLFHPDMLGQTFFSQNMFSLAPEQLTAFTQRLDALLTEFGMDTDPQVPATSLLTIMLHPLASSGSLASSASAPQTGKTE
jgi:DNA-binding transcriptional ArsR family regulator